MSTPCPTRSLCRLTFQWLIPLLSLAASTLPAQDTFVTGLTAGKGWPLVPLRVVPAFGRVDMDCDVNYDGVITNDGSDSGELERNPPGLVVTAGYMAKMIFRITPFATPGTGKSQDTEINLENVAVRLEVRPINLLRRDGLFIKEEEEVKAGKVVIWADAKRTRQLLDSSDPSKRRIDWKLIAAEAPGQIFIETVVPAEATAGCLVVLELEKTTRKGYKEGTFIAAAARDYILVTPKPSGAAMPAQPQGSSVRSMLGFGNYAGFAKTDKDTQDVWVQIGNS